jgi:hypothetical protein
MPRYGTLEVNTHQFTGRVPLCQITSMVPVALVDLHGGGCLNRISALSSHLNETACGW